MLRGFLSGEDYDIFRGREILKIPLEKTNFLSEEDKLLPEVCDYQTYTVCTLYSVHSSVCEYLFYF